MAKNIVYVTDETLQETISSADIVILDVWAPWCGPCKMISPVLDAIAESNPDVIIAKLNADDTNALGDLQVRSVPTLIKYSSGVEVGRKIGASSKSQLEDFILGRG